MKRTISEIVDALKRAGGMQRTAAGLLGMTPQGLAQRIKRHPVLQATILDCKEAAKDALERTALELAINKKDSSMTRFLLDRLAKDRGYGTARQLVDGANTINQDELLKGLSHEQVAFLRTIYDGGSEGQKGK